MTVAGVFVIGLTGCTGRGGGQLPPSLGFAAPASFGFSFSCEDKGGINPPTGQLRIQLSYTEHGTSLVGSSFAIHGTVDEVDPVTESMFCVGQEPPPDPYPNLLTFLGRYRFTSSAPAGFPSTCTETTSQCRFEVTVQDNDRGGGPSTGDFFEIKLSKVTVLGTRFANVDVPYTRAGNLSSGNLTVD
jgi:hypothetical protein